jgi:hypothetical protein
MYDVAMRFGQRTWVNQSIGGGLGAAFEMGRPDDWLEEMREAEPGASEFYAMWFRSELALRMAYEGRIQEALAIVEAARASEAVKNSAQGSAGLEELTGEINLLGGRFEEAFEIGRRGWPSNEVVESALALSSLAAAAAADLEWTEEVNRAMFIHLVNMFPNTVGLRQMGATFKALLEGRWDDARRNFLSTSRQLDSMQRFRTKARFQLAVAQLAGDRFPEAIDGLRDAEAWFEERGAGWLPRAYREQAVRPPDQRRASGQAPGAASGKTAEASIPGE